MTSMQIAPALESRLKELLAVFLEENQKLNLSAFRMEESCWIGNILDSLAFLDTGIDVTAGSRLLDVGTGGGFPLLPLAIARPDIQCAGLDAVAKKIRAVERIIERLGLKNVRTIVGRSEDSAHNPEHRDWYAIVTSRAVAPLPILLEYTTPFARTGGSIVLWKSLRIEEELTASKRAREVLHCTLEKTYRYTLPHDFGERQLLIFRKTAETPAEYPRGVGMAKKTPL